MSPDLAEKALALRAGVHNDVEDGRPHTEEDAVDDLLIVREHSGYSEVLKNLQERRESVQRMAGPWDCDWLRRFSQTCEFTGHSDAECGTLPQQRGRSRWQIHSMRERW